MGRLDNGAQPDERRVPVKAAVKMWKRAVCFILDKGMIYTSLFDMFKQKQCLLFKALISSPLKILSLILSSFKHLPKHFHPLKKYKPNYKTLRVHCALRKKMIFKALEDIQT